MKMYIPALPRTIMMIDDARQTHEGKKAFASCGGLKGKRYNGYIRKCLADAYLISALGREHS
jgi:hypothetical protein